MMNQTVKRMQTKHIDGILTLENDDYYFDGKIAYPIKCECGGIVKKLNNNTNYCIFDKELKGFKLEYVKHEDLWYRCDECSKELYELYPDKKGNWY